MIHILGATTITLPVICIEWEPKNWSDREAWGKDYGGYKEGENGISAIVCE